MDSSRGSWTESNRQLWTSSAEIDQAHSSPESAADMSRRPGSPPISETDSSHLESAIESCLKECQGSGGGLLSSHAESGLTSLLTEPGAGVHVKKLVSILLATNSRRRSERQEDSTQQREEAKAQRKLKSIADEIFKCLRGESTDAESFVEDDLYRILLDVEKCVELAQLSTGVKKPCLREILLDACGDCLVGPVQKEKGSDDSGSSAVELYQDAIEVLQSHGYLADKEDSASEAILQIIKDAESAKRQAGFMKVALRQYERLVHARFASYGEDRPPLASAVEAHLREGTVDVEATLKEVPWWTDRLQRMCDHLANAPAICVAGVDIPCVDALQVTPDNAGQSKRSTAAVLDAADATIVALIRDTSECTKAVEALRELLQGAELLPPNPRGATSTSQKDPLSAKLRVITDGLVSTLGLASPACSRIEAAQTPTTCEDEYVNSKTGPEGTATVPPSTVLGRVIDRIPLAVRAKFHVEKFGLYDEKRTLQLLDAIGFLDDQNRGVAQRIDELCSRLRSTFQMNEPRVDQADTWSERTLSDQLSFLEDAVSAACHRSSEAVLSESTLAREIRQSIDELAQLLPISELPQQQQQPISDGHVRVAPPTHDLMEMTRILRTRLLAWQQAQTKRNSLGAQYRTEKLRLEEDTQDFVTTAKKLLTDIMASVSADPVLVEEPGEGRRLEGGDEGSALLGRPPQPDRSLEDVVDRLKLVKSRVSRMSQANAALRARVDMLGTKAKGEEKAMKKIAEWTASICKSLGVEFTEDVATSRQRDKDHAVAKGTIGKLDLRSDSPSRRAGTTAGKRSGGKEPTSATAAELVANALEQIASRVTADDELVKKSMADGELERLRRAEKRADSDTKAFKQAIAMVLTRLADSGKLVKQSLFLLGTDESPSDDVVERVLGRQSAEAPTGGDHDDDDDHETNERLLAALLQKYARWSRRLVETTEDHLDTQKKLVKYFAAVRRFFVTNDTDDGRGATGDALSEPDMAVDENLIDIDTALMRCADVILPCLDRVLRRHSSRQATGESRGGGAGGADALAVGSPRIASADRLPASPRSATAADDRSYTESTSVTSPSCGGEGLPYDHRLGRLYEMIARLHTMVTSLLRVRYLSVPTGSRQRSSGEQELLFDIDDGLSSDYVDLDLDKLARVSSSPTADATGGDTGGPERFSREQGGGRPSSSEKPTVRATSERVSVNNDLIYRVATQNLDCVYQAVRKFSSNHKMASILIQKDTDAVQENIAAMLEKYSELDIEQAFGQDRGELHSMYSALKERGTRQKGCYFFDRVNGEGRCVWLRALEGIGGGFQAMIDKLVERTATVSRLHELVSEVVDLCAMYVSWAERAGVPATHELPDDVLADCVRDGAMSGQESAVATTEEAAVRPLDQLPPKPSVEAASGRTPRECVAAPGEAVPAAPGTATRNVSYFRRQETVLKVIAHMFRLAQEAAEGSAEAAVSPERLQQMEEELQLLRESVTVAEQRTAALQDEKTVAEMEKDKALSEAAVARAELRRWRRLSSESRQSQQQPQSQPQPQLEAAGSRAATPASGANASVGSDHGAGAGEQQDCLQEMLQYMKVLGEEVRYANRIAGRHGGSGEDVGSEGEFGASDVSAEVQPLSRTREARQRLQAAYGSATPLHVVADSPRGGYADAWRSGRTPSRQPPPERFFSNKNFSYRGEGGDGGAPRRRGTPSGGPRTTTPQRRGVGGLASTPLRRAAAAEPRQQLRAVPRSGQAYNAFSPPLDDITPLPPAEERVSFLGPSQQLQQQQRARGRDAVSRQRRHRSPAEAAAATRTQPHFGDALRIVEAGEEPEPPVRGAAVNANVRAAALRQLAEVVSKTRVRGPRGDWV